MFICSADVAGAGRRFDNRHQECAGRRGRGAVVEMMRNGGGKKALKAEEAATGIDISGLGIDLD